MLLIPVFCFSQKVETPRPVYPVDLRRSVSSFNCGKIERTDTSLVRNYLLNTLPNLRGAEFSLDYINEKRSKTGWHYLYRQNYHGMPVYRGTVKINLDETGNILSLFDNTYKILQAPPGEFPTAEDSYTIVNALYHEENDIVKISVENMYFDEGETLIPASRIELWDKNGNFFEMIINSDAKIVYERDMNNYFNKKNISYLDTPALARIFNPDPLTTAGVSYGAPYEDGADVDISQLNMQRQEVTIDVTLENDTFKLENAYCKITEHSPPTVNPATSITPSFVFTRSQDGFEDVNAFYHINVYNAYVRQLGFTDLVDFPIWVDTHGMSGADNSNFSAASGSPRLSFGEGGVDDAEDADVIIHEYGHAISYSAAPSTNSGTERQALDEALGDYFAASYSKTLNPYSWENVFSWDGHNSFWNGRIVNSTEHYPEDLDSHMYKDATLWSSTMMQIMDNIGRENTDEVQIEALYSYASGMTMTDAANLVIQADVLLHGGGFVLPIRYWMCSRGFIPCGVGMDETAIAPFTLLNTMGFAAGNSDAVIRFNTIQSGKLEIMDVRGKIVHSESFSGVVELNLSPELLENGIYLMNITGSGVNGRYKLSKW